MSDNEELSFEGFEEPAAETPPEVEVEASPKESNAVQDRSHDLGETPGLVYRVSLPSYPLASYPDRLFGYRLNDGNITEEIKEWQTVHQESATYHSPGGVYQSRFSDPGSSFRQGMLDPTGNTLQTGPLSIKKADGELKGEMAILKVSKHLGLGDVENVMLPHSGIWVTIKPPTERELIDFYNSVVRDKNQLGRRTYGLSFSNFSTVFNAKLFDFVCSHIHSINYKDIDVRQLGNYILANDLPILFWGMACGMYPNGFDYQRACMTANEDNQCFHVVKDKLSLPDLLWDDVSALSPAQTAILAEKRPNRLTVEAYRTYQAEHTRVIANTVELDNGMKFRLRVPTANESFADGTAWVEGINSAVERVLLNMDESDEESRRELLDQYVRSSILRQFSHFVEEITVDDNTITDRDTINLTMELLSSNDKIRPQLQQAIVKYKEATTVAVVGLAEYVCPACKCTQAPVINYPRITNVVPIDSAALFFLMLTFRIMKILDRDS